MNPTPNKRAGRKYQSYLANRLGGKSVGTIEPQDISHPIWSIEAKKRKTFAGQKFMQQAVKNCPADKTPIAIVHITGDSHNDDIVMMRLKDWEEWYGRI
jgi:hypothetical protein